MERDRAGGVTCLARVEDLALGRELIEWPTFPAHRISELGHRPEPLGKRSRSSILPSSIGSMSGLVSRDSRDFVPKQDWRQDPELDVFTGGPG